MDTICIIAQTATAARELSAGVSRFGGTAFALLLHDDEQKCVLADTGAIIEKVVAQRPQLVLVEATFNGRMIAAAVGAAIDSNVLTDCLSLEIERDTVRSERLVFGGAATQVEEATMPCVVCMNSKAFEITDEMRDDALGEDSMTVIDYESSPDDRYSLVERLPVPPRTIVLDDARKVIAVGRGLQKQENLAAVEELARALDGVVGCTRPVAEEEKWLPKETYIGVSGAMLKPDVYLGIGLSGQIQHTIGINQSMTIFAINKDRHALIFEQCDYGIVGDQAQIVPAILQRL